MTQLSRILIASFDSSARNKTCVILIHVWVYPETLPFIWTISFFLFPISSSSSFTFIFGIRPQYRRRANSSIAMSFGREVTWDAPTRQLPLAASSPQRKSAGKTSLFEWLNCIAESHSKFNCFWPIPSFLNGKKVSPPPFPPPHSPGAVHMKALVSR